MLHIIIKISIVFIIIFITKNINDVNKFNPDSNIIEIDDTEYIKGKENIQDPLVIKYNINSNIKELNDIIDININNFIIENNTLTTFTELNFQSNINIQNSAKLYDILNISHIHDEIFTYFNNMFSFNKKNLASIYKGINITPITKNKHNIHLLICLMGKCELFLYNPKHADILYNKNIKKWSTKIDISNNNNNIIYIPPNWNYSIETNSDCILSTIDCDNLFTFLYNDYRN